MHVNVSQPPPCGLLRWRKVRYAMMFKQISAEIDGLDKMELILAT